MISNRCSGPGRFLGSFFLDRRRSVRGILTNYVRGGEGRAAVWQIVKRRACVRALAVTVGRIISREGAQRGAVKAAGQGTNRH